MSATKGPTRSLDCSIVIATYDRPAALAETLRSCQAQTNALGLTGEIVDHPLLPICRSQIDVRFKAPSETVADRMPGFHWILVYGDYAREVGYALGKVPVQWDFLG